MALTPLGYWNALTNDPQLVDGTGTIGDFYIIGTGSPNRDLGSGLRPFTANMGVMYSQAGQWLPMPVLLTLDINDFLGGTPGSGTVTSVAMSTPSLLTVVGSPSTTAGTLSLTWAGLTAGDVLYASATNTLATLGIGSNGQVLTIAGGIPSWATPSGGTGTVTNIATTGPITGGPITTTGTIGITQSSSGSSGYLSAADWITFNSKQAIINGTGFVKAIGTTISYDNSTYYLASNPSSYIPLTSLSGTSPIQYNNLTGVFSILQSSSGSNGYLSSNDWSTFNNKLTNPMSVAGDMVYETSGVTAARLPVGIANQILTVVSGLPKWTTAPFLTSPMTTTGDIIYQSSGNTATRLAVGGTGQVLTVSGGNPTWAPITSPPGLIESISFNDIGSSIGNNTYTLDLYAEYGYTINELKIIAGSGSCTAAIQIEGVSVTGISAVSVTTTIATGTATAANIVAAGVKVTLVLSSTSSLNNLQGTLKITRN